MPVKRKTQKVLTKEDKIAHIKALASKKEVTIILDLDEKATDLGRAGHWYAYNKKSKVLNLIVPNVDFEHKEVVLDIIRKVFSTNGLIFKDDKSKTLESYVEYSELNSDKRVLEFFVNILPYKDFQALKMALYLRSEQSKGVNISAYKKDIRERFGDRGANIANLCTAGYFEYEFMPLYNIATKSQFDEYYEIAVDKKARALFIHTGMSVDDIEIAFDDMLAKALKYHMEDFRVHGLGNVNVANIKEFFGNKKTTSEDNFFIQKGYEKQENPPVVEYVVTISYK